MNLFFSPPVIAHRGASAYAPENTLIAFTKAVQLGIKWIEFDIMTASCGEPIVFHDEILERTSSGNGYTSQYPYHYLQTLDVGSWFHPIFSGEKIPTLKQVLQFLKDAKIAANLEIKAELGKEELFVKRILKEVKEYFSLTDSRLLFSSFSKKTLQHLRKNAVEANIGLLLHEWEAGWQSICDSLDCVSVHVNDQIITPQSVDFIKGMNKSVLCYTVNDFSRANELYSWGVDAVFSDRPDEIVKHTK